MNARAPFTSTRTLPSGRVNARYRPRQAAHRTKTFDTMAGAAAWLEQLQSEALEAEDVSSVTKRREYRRKVLS